MTAAKSKKSAEQVAKYADMFTAMGTEPRLRIMQLLLSAHPDGLVVGEIQSELGIPNSTLSHHLEKLKNEELVKVRRESTFLWYTANTEALEELLGFLYAECCTAQPRQCSRDKIVTLCKSDLTRRRYHAKVANMPETHKENMEIKEIVKEKYGQAALRVATGGSSCCGASANLDGCCVDPITSNLYDAGQTGQIPEEAVQASLGCGNPTALAKLNAGETVLDLGSGGGIDVLAFRPARRAHRQSLRPRHDR